MKLELPQIGLGTCFGSPEEMKQAITWAIDIGYSWDLRYIWRWEHYLVLMIGWNSMEHIVFFKFQVQIKLEFLSSILNMSHAISN